MKKQSIQMILQRSPKRKYLVSLLAVVLVVGGVFGLRALSHETVYISGLQEDKSVDDLFAQSSLVAVGQITGHSDAIRVQHVTEDNAVNFTDYTFSISSLVQGQPDTDTVTVRVLGGTAGNVTEVYEESPIFSDGETYLLFLYQPGMGGAYNTAGDYYYLCGVNQGVYTADSNGRYVSSHGEVLPLAQLSAANHTASVNETFSRDQFLENQRLNLANGFISQAEYDTLIGSMDKYAEVISK